MTLQKGSYFHTSPDLSSEKGAECSIIQIKQCKPYNNMRRKGQWIDGASIVHVLFKILGSQWRHSSHRLKRGFHRLCSLMMCLLHMGNFIDPNIAFIFSVIRFIFIIKIWLIVWLITKLSYFMHSQLLAVTAWCQYVVLVGLNSIISKIF